MTKTRPTKASHNGFQPLSQQQTLIDHLHELRARLFWIILMLILATSASYVIKDQIMAVIMQPLGGQPLVYLTPIGGFNFIFKVSLYFGLLVVLPVIIYHLYRFLEPLMQARRKRSVFFFILASLLLAVAGGSFAYFAGLPAALHFLTGFAIQNVSAMLTVESYLAFVVTYILGFAALFQIPLILMIFNTIRPIPPRKLMGLERFVILGAFIVAAIISPTPDITNQAILAVPIIGMYQVGVLLVWLQNRRVSRRGQRLADRTQSVMPSAKQPAINHAAAPVQQLQPQTMAAAAAPIRRIQRPIIMDVAAPVAQPLRPKRPQRVADITPPRRSPNVRPQPRSLTTRTGTSIDGIVPRSQPLSQAG